MPLRRSLLVAAVLAALTGHGQAADIDPSAPVVATAQAEMAVKGVVRFGPNKAAKAVTILSPGTAVEIIGPSASAPDWYVIRFPRQGKAWVHTKNLQQAGEGRWRVVGKGANVRDDATLGASIVAQLAVGEMLEDMGQKVGDFVAVYPANAVAYTYKDNVRLATGAPDPAALKPINETKRKEADALWAVVQVTYNDFRSAVQARPEVAIAKDWDGLKAQLEQVATSHPDVQVRVVAATLREKVIEAGKAAEAYAKSIGVTATPEAKVPQPGSTPATTAKTPEAAAVATALPTIAPVSTYAAEGLVIQQPFPKLDVTYVVMDADQKVLAFLKTKDGALQLSEYVYRFVGVKGQKDLPARDLTGLDRDVPVITADEIVLLNR
jgi:hypothetical protein